MSVQPADGGPLPEQSGDDTDVGWGERPEPEDGDLERYRRERPPHHGD